MRVFKGYPDGLGKLRACRSFQKIIDFLLRRGEAVLRFTPPHLEVTGTAQTTTPALPRLADNSKRQD